jgi:hypothetical protein
MPKEDYSLSPRTRQMAEAEARVLLLMNTVEDMIMRDIDVPDELVERLEEANDNLEDLRLKYPKQ